MPVGSVGSGPILERVILNLSEVNNRFKMKRLLSSRAFYLGISTPRPVLRTVKLEGHTAAEPRTQA